MISIIVFSVAMIGLMALQVVSMSSAQSSGYRMTATSYAYDLIDKMKSNKDAVTAGTYLTGSYSNNSCRSVNYNTVNTVVACNSTQMAKDDLQEFYSEVASLPNGQAVVCLDSQQSPGTPTAPNCDGLGNDYVIKIFWKDSRSQLIGTNSGYSQLVVGAQL